MGELNNQHLEYDDEPVYYCRNCHSLNIQIDDSLSGDDWDGSFCADCHSCDIASCSIEEWLKEDERRAKLKEQIEWRK